MGVGALAWGLAALAAAGPVETLQVGTTTLTLPIPAGYCKPAGAQELADAQTMAAADVANVTLSTLVPCNRTAALYDYYLVKSPTTTLAVTIDRTTLIAEMVKVMGVSGTFTPPADMSNEAIEKRLEALVGERRDIEGDVKGLGNDDVCFYMGGVLTISTPTVSVKRAVSVCITSVGGKVVGFYRYSDGAMAGNVGKHLATVRAMALSATPAR